MKSLKIIEMAGEIVPVYKKGKPLSSEMPKINGSNDAARYLREVWKNHCTDISVAESFVVVHLNRANRVIAFEVVSRGTAVGCLVDVQSIFRTSLKIGSQGVILSHNHPSGHLVPSESDIKLTQKISSASKFLDVKVLDHIINHQRAITTLLWMKTFLFNVCLCLLALRGLFLVCTLRGNPIQEYPKRTLRNSGQI
jgi:DNA repair protein RadC